MSRATHVVSVVDRARSRAAWNLLWSELSVGAIAALGLLTSLLVAGTEILNWFWPSLALALGAAVALWRGIRRIPSPYAVAQDLDRRLGLHDLISTAYHFRDAGPSARHPGSLLEAQRAEAERAAAGIDPAAAVPWQAPRSSLAVLVLAVAALGLFALRYGTLGSLSLRAPIVEAMADFFQPGEQIVSRNKQKPPTQPGEDPLGVAVEQTDSSPRDERANENPLPPLDVAAPGEPSEFERARRQDVTAAPEEGEGEEGDRAGGSDQQDREGGPPGETGKSGEKQKPNPKGGGNDNSSLLDKMRDAMANLLAKLNIQPPPGLNQERASNQKGNQSGGERKGGRGEKGEKGAGEQQGKGERGEQGEADADAQGDEQAAAQGQGKSDKAGDETPGQEKSGIGKQDGDKSIQDAEQQAALGKLSEIFGKRAQNMSGDVMVEVTSSKQQQLRTQYSQSGAAHREAGGEIHRDEIPLELQQYVQQYFEQVRKGEAAPARSPAPENP